MLPSVMLSTGSIGCKGLDTNCALLLYLKRRLIALPPCLPLTPGTQGHMRASHYQHRPLLLHITQPTVGNTRSSCPARTRTMWQFALCIHRLHNNSTRIDTTLLPWVCTLPNCRVQCALKAVLLIVLFLWQPIHTHTRTHTHTHIHTYTHTYTHTASVVDESDPNYPYSALISPYMRHKTAMPKVAAALSATGIKQR